MPKILRRPKDTRPTVVSLFSGVGGFDLGLERAGWRVIGQVEIDAFCGQVLQKHWPDVPLHTDVTTAIEWWRSEPRPAVDMVCGGFPCQDVSVAGKRAGLGQLSDEVRTRTGLFYDAMDFIREVQPKRVLLENVPGLMTSNKGQDIVTVLSTLEEMGYIVDIDLLDSQFFGVPQRRRRVFITGWLASDTAKTRTPTSALIGAQCLSDISASILAEALSRSTTGLKPSDLPAGLSVAGRQRRMTLFGLGIDGDLSETWRKNLAAAWETYRPVPADLASDLGGSQDFATDTATSSESGETRAVEDASQCWSTEQSWLSCWDDLYDVVSTSTTSTPTSSTTDPTTSVCSMLLDTAALTLRLKDSCPNYWSAASSVMTALEVCTDYARTRNSELRQDVGGLYDWGAVVRQAEDLLVALRRTRDPRSTPVLLEPEGVRGDLAPGDEEGQEAAGAARRSSAGGSGAARLALDPNDPDDIRAGRRVGPIQAQGATGGFRFDADGAGAGHILPIALNADDGVARALVSGGNNKHDATRTNYVATGYPDPAGTVTTRIGKGINSTLDDGAVVVEGRTGAQDRPRKRIIRRASAV